MVVHKIAAIILNDKKFLAVKEYGMNILLTPGGRIEAGEDSEETLRRELKEELGVNLVSMEFFGVINGKTHDMKDDLVLETYFADVSGTPKPSSEIENLFWVGSKFNHGTVELSTPMKKNIIPKLLQMGLIE